MGDQKKPRARTTIRFTAEVYAALDTIGKQTGASLQFSVDKAMEAYLRSPAIRVLLKKKRGA